MLEWLINNMIELTLKLFSMVTDPPPPCDPKLPICPTANTPGEEEEEHALVTPEITQTHPFSYCKIPQTSPIKLLINTDFYMKKSHIRKKKWMMVGEFTSYGVMLPGNLLWWKEVGSSGFQAAAEADDLWMEGKLWWWSEINLFFCLSRALWFWNQ